MAGTVATVLFADVVGSTERARRIGDVAWAEELEAFHSHAAAAVRDFGGRRVKDTGDGVLAAFASPLAALRCADQLVAAASRVGFDVRVGVHTGECQITDGGDLRGAAVHLAARVTSSGGPGEVHASRTVRDLVEGGEVVLRSAGLHAFKGFDEPVEVFRLDALGPGITTSQLDSSAQDRPAAPLVGRTREREAIGELLDAASAGRVAVLALEGEGGSGKSRLLAEAAAMAERRGFVRLRGSADDLSGEVVFAPIREALGIDRGLSLDVERSRLADLLRTANVGTGDLVDAFLDAIERLALTTPVLLVVDDLQWADSVTLRALRALLLRVKGVPIAVALASRTAPRPPELDHLLEAVFEAGGTALRLAALDAEEVADLTRAIVGAVPGPLLSARLRGAGGNPLFVTELVRALESEGALAIADGAVESTADVLPADLRQILLRRVNAVGAEASEALRVAAVLGSSFSIADLAAVTGVGLSQIVRTLEPAVRASLIGEASERMEFRHDVIREAIYYDLPGPLRKALHMDVARTLDAKGRHGVQVAEHYLLGSEHEDEAVIAFVRAVATDVRGHSPDVALRLLQRLLTTIEPRTERHDDVATELLELLPAFGLSEEAKRLGNEILARRPSPAVAARARWGLRVAEFLDGTMNAESIAALEHIESLDPSLREFNADLVAMLNWFIDPAAAEAHAMRRLDGAVAGGDVNAEFLQHVTLASINAGRGDATRCLEHASAAVALRDRQSVRVPTLMLPHIWAGVAYGELDRIDESLASFRAGARRAESLGLIVDMPWNFAALGSALYIYGRWDEAEAEAATAVAVADSWPGQKRFNELLLVFGTLARIALHRGDREAAQASIARAQEVVAAAGGSIGLDAVLLTQALLLEDQGDVEQAAGMVGFAWEVMGPGRYIAIWRTLGPEAVRLALAVGDTDRAAAVARDVELGAKRNPTVSTRALALLCRGLVESDRDSLLDAVAGYRAAPRPTEAARALEIVALALPDAEDELRTELLRDALARSEALGAAGDVRRIEGLLGVTRRAKRSRAVTGWESLSPAEVNVARLVADGLTNREAGERLFVSRRTVETHLGHIFAKLGVNSRARVAAIAAQNIG